jgi:hypothetical protein
MMRQPTICSTSCEETGGQEPQYQPRQQQQQASDVLMGRGQPVMVNKGNQVFIEIIRSRSAEYHSIKSRKQKHIIAQQIASAVKSQRGGLFLRKIESPEEAKSLGVPADTPVDTAWAVVNDENALLLKIKQALRDQGLVMDKKQSSQKAEDESHNNKRTTRKRPRVVVSKTEAAANRDDAARKKFKR